MNLQDRQTELKKLYRYKGFTKHMFFRPNLEIHTKRVVLISGYICDILLNQGIELDKNYIIALSYMHDDDEFVTGDFVSMDKLKFTPEEQQKYEDACMNAIDILVENYGENFMGYSYRTLLKDNNSGESLEYKIMDLADKLDAHGEVCHELFNGNEEFLRKVYYKGYGDIDLFEGTYNRSFERLQKLERTVNISLSFLEQISSAQEMLGSKTVQSVEDIQAIQTDYSFYKFWLDLQLENFSEADLEKLYIKSNGNIS